MPEGTPAVVTDTFDDIPENAASAFASPRLKTTLGVVIINYRTPDLVIQCLAALGPQLSQADAHVVVVDNHSNDASPDAIASYLEQDSFLEKDTDTSWKERISLVRSKENTGFSGGNNIGVSYLDASYYLFLNSDTIVRENALKALLDSAATHPQAGIIGPRLEDLDGTPQQSVFRFHSPLSEFLAGAGLSLFDALFRFAIIARPIPETVTHADWVSFACVLIKRDAIDAAGPMDEGYFMYYEDADYARDVKKAGFKIVYDPSARVVHLRGGSSPVKAAMHNKKRPPAYYYASRTRFFRKTWGPLGHILANVAWQIGRLFARLKLLAGKPTSPACDHQGVDHWTNWRAPLGDRRAPSDG